MTRSTVRKIWDLLTPPERKNAYLLIGLMLVGMLFETLGVGLVIPVVGLLSQPNFVSAYPALQPALAYFGNSSRETIIIGVMVLLIVVYLLKAAYLVFLSWWQMRFAYGVQKEVSQRLFELYLRQPYSFHLNRNSAQLIHNVTGEIQVFTFSTILPSLELFAESLVLIGLCTLLLVVEPIGTLIVVPTMAVATWGFHHSTRARLTRWGRLRQVHEGGRIQHLQQGLGGIKDLKLLGRESGFIDQYAEHNAQTARVGRYLSTLKQLPRLWLEVLAISGLAGLVIAMVANGRAIEAIVPALGLFGAAAFRLLPSINRVLGAMQSLRFGLPVVNVLHTELMLAPQISTEAKVPVSTFHQSLEFRSVAHSYPNAETLTLKNVTFTINRGESVGFIGPSGAGKSTLIDILLGLLLPNSGEVCVDGINVKTNLRSWQNHIGYVPQTIFLTDDTLRRNVAFGLADDQIDEGAVLRAIKSAQLETFIGSLPEGLNTMVGERGVRLSGGQRQRIGIARSLYHDPDVLVLDEATSSLDTVIESDVVQAVQALHGSKTIIIVAHRLSTVANCDRIYRLEEGRIVAEGPPEQMLSRPSDVVCLENKM